MVLTHAAGFVTRLPPRWNLRGLEQRTMAEVAPWALTRRGRRARGSPSFSVALALGALSPS